MATVTVTVTELRRSRMVAVLPFRRGLHSLRPPLSFLSCFPKRRRRGRLAEAAESTPESR